MKIFLKHLDTLDKESITKIKKDILQMQGETAQILCGPHGKPYLEGNPWYFNLSHSGEYLLFVRADHEVGVDIQLKRECNVENLTKKCCTSKEREWVLEACSEEEKKDRFYQIWCRKEAYGKYLGCGLTEAIFGTNTQNFLDTITFLEYDILEGYQICICCKKEEKIEEITHLPEGL